MHIGAGQFDQLRDAQAGLDSEANKLGAVPPAAATFVQTAMAQHQQALDTWNSVLQKAGQAPVRPRPISRPRSTSNSPR